MLVLVRGFRYIDFYVLLGRSEEIVVYGYAYFAFSRNVLVIGLRKRLVSIVSVRYEPYSRKARQARL